MTIGNDAFTIGTAATAAGIANVGYQNRAAIRSNFIDPVLKADTYKSAVDKTVHAAESAKNKVKSKVLNGVRTAKNAWKTRKDPKIMKEFEEVASKGKSIKDSVKDSFKDIGKKVAEGSKSLWNKAGNFIKNTNWKKAGKYAGVAAAIATAAVVAKNLLFSSKDDVEEI